MSKDMKNPFIAGVVIITGFLTADWLKNKVDPLGTLERTVEKATDSKKDADSKHPFPEPLIDPKDSSVADTLKKEASEVNNQGASTRALKAKSERPERLSTVWQFKGGHYLEVVVQKDVQGAYYFMDGGKRVDVPANQVKSENEYSQPALAR